MSTATMRSRGAGQGRATEERGSRVWFWLILVAALALVVFLVAWFGGWIRVTTDPRVTEILAMQQEARAKYAADGGPRTLVEATAAMAAMESIRQKVEALPAPLRPQVERAGSSLMRNVVRGRIDAYFAVPADRRQAELDRQIDQEEIMRKASEAAGALMGAVGGGRRGGGDAGPGDGRAGAGPSRGGAGGGPPSGGSQEDRNRWRKNIIDTTSPEQRARYAEYRRAMERRREERGLPSGGPR